MAKRAEKIACEARKACEQWNDYFKINIDQYHDMHEFVLGRQWKADEEDLLIRNKKVPLQVNKLATMMNSLLGEQQQNTPQLQVLPMDNCDEKTAEIRELIIKDIMFSSDTKVVYQVAAAQAGIGGYGAFALFTDYVHEKSFDTIPKYKYFKNATQCYWDPGAETINKTDGMVCGYLSRMSRERFSQVYGKNIEEKIRKQSEGAQYESDEDFSWCDNDSIVINDYFVRSYKKEKLYRLSNGNYYNEKEMEEIVVNSEKINKEIQQEEMLLQEQIMQQQMSGMLQQEGQEIMPQQEPMEDAIQPQQVEIGDEDAYVAPDNIMQLWDDGEPVRIEDEKEIKHSIIHHYKIAGDYILEDSEFPSEDLPVIFRDQNSYYDKEGRQICRPFIIDAVDSQRYLNYLATQSAYSLKISRFDQWIGSKKNVASNDTQQVWRDPSNVQGLLTYDESPSGARPEQIRPPELSTSLVTQYQRAMDDLYTSTGLYPTRMGDQGNEISGTAINARTRQGSYATYIFFNNGDRAIEAGGKVLNQMIPRVMDTERVISLMTPNGHKNITINKQLDDYGVTIDNDLRKGTFQVKLIAGPSYEGQKQEALQSFNMVLQSNPQLFNMFADLYVDNLPLNNTIELKNRLKTIVPPEIIEAGKTGDTPPPQPPQPDPVEMAVQVEAEKNQMRAENDRLKAEIDIQRLEMEKQKLEQEMELKGLEIAAKLEEQKLRYRAETERTQSREEIAKADNIIKLISSKIQ